MTSPTYGGGRGLPKGDISLYAYLVKWVTWGAGAKNLKKEVTYFVNGPQVIFDIFSLIPKLMYYLFVDFFRL